MQGMEWECGCGESTCECGDLRGIVKNVVNQGGDAGNQAGNLSIALEMTQNNNEMINSKSGKK